MFFLSAEKRFKGVKTTAKVCTQKSFLFNISKNNSIFLVKPTPKYFLKKGNHMCRILVSKGYIPYFFEYKYIFLNAEREVIFQRLLD